MPLDCHIITFIIIDYYRDNGMIAEQCWKLNIDFEMNKNKMKHESLPLFEPKILFENNRWKKKVNKTFKYIIIKEIAINFKSIIRITKEKYAYSK